MKAMKTFAALLALAFSLAGCGAVDGDPVRPAPGSAGQLTELDVSKNSALWHLSCYDNKLTKLDVSQNQALKNLSCHTNQLTKLDVSKNTALDKLYCYSNQLTSLDVSQTAVTELRANDNQITIKVEEAPRTFELSTLPGFDVTKATNWSGGTVSGKTLKVNTGATQVTYTYDCGKGFSRNFTLNVEVVPDGTVMPPSGRRYPGRRLYRRR